MPKPAAVMYVLIATSLLVFFSMTPHSGPRPRGGRRLHEAFDPLIDQLEQQAQKEGMLDVPAFREKLWSDNGMLAYYFDEEGSLDTKERLIYLFPLLDHAPKDGFISFAELDLWNKRQAMDRLMHSTHGRMRMHDKNRNGEVTLSEFLSHIPEEKRDWNDEEHGKPGWWKNLFMNADMDNSGFLVEAEFNDLLHPEDSTNPKVQMWCQIEKLCEMDQNQDGKLSFEEFRDQTQGIFSYFLDFDTVKDVNSGENRAKQNFAELDVNEDKFLTAEELGPIINLLRPGEFSLATYYSKYLMHTADDNRDGKLTLKEMLDHHQEFYIAVFEEEPYNFYDDDYNHYDHDELR